MTLTEAVKRLKKLGLKVVSQERTPGAIKRWLTYPPQVLTSKEEFAYFRGQILKTLGIDPQDLVEIPTIRERSVPFNRGYGISLSFQNTHNDDFFGLFIAVPTRTREGKEYQLGIDG